MTNPKTPQELNEAVAEKLGLTLFPPDESYPPWICRVKEYEDWNGHYANNFSPATDPAAALWALERFCNDNECIGAFVRFDRQSWTCSIVNADNKTTGRGMGTFCEAICLAIVGASG